MASAPLPLIGIPRTVTWDDAKRAWEKLKNFVRKKFKIELPDEMMYRFIEMAEYGHTKCVDAPDDFVRKFYGLQICIYFGPLIRGVQEELAFEIKYVDYSDPDEPRTIRIGFPIYPPPQT